jgi:hypothetical protein
VLLFKITEKLATFAEVEENVGYLNQAGLYLFGEE